MRRVLLPGLLLLALLAPVARGEDPAGEASDLVTAEQRDDALRAAFGALDEALLQRFAAYEQQKIFAAAAAGWSYLLAKERGRGNAHLPSRSRELPRIADLLEQYLKKVERFLDRSPGDPAPPAGGPPDTPPGFPSMAGLDGIQCNWPVALCGWFFAEAHARGELRRQAKANLKRVVAILEATQQEDGGWGHDDARRGGVSGMPLPIPDPTGRHGSLDYPKTLLSATNAAAPALAAARRALGLEPGDAVARALAYYAAAQNADGSFPYDPSQRHDHEGVEAMSAIAAPLTAGAVLAHFAAERPTSPTLERAIAFLDAHADGVSEGHGSATYGLLIGALAARARGPEAWADFRSRFFRRILDAQREDGTFACACAHGSFGTTCDTEPIPGLNMPGMDADGRMYVTALHALILALDRTGPEALPLPPARPAAATTPR